MFISIMAYSAVYSAPDEVNKFFDTLEYKLREDYRICSGDSSTRTISQLLIWKRRIDAFTESDSFKTIAQAFYKETGLSAFEVNPCKILLWKNNNQKEMIRVDQLFSDDLVARQKKIQDSLHIATVLQNASISTLDFAGIPFGITKNSFIRFVNFKLNAPFKDEESIIQFKQVSIEGIIVNAAFHFDKNGYYRMYEFESEGGPLDSLDSKVRLESEELAAFIEFKSGSPPSHIFRIGRFDITQGRLAIERSWNLQSVSAFAGLATFRYHYYAKAVVIARNIISVPDSLYQNK